VPVLPFAFLLCVLCVSAFRFSSVPVANHHADPIIHSNTLREPPRSLRLSVILFLLFSSFTLDTSENDGVPEVYFLSPNDPPISRLGQFSFEIRHFGDDVHRFAPESPVKGKCPPLDGNRPESKTLRRESRRREIETPLPLIKTGGCRRIRIVCLWRDRLTTWADYKCKIVFLSVSAAVVQALEMVRAGLLLLSA
jgi:hypothetical protein